jgi:hypothetical protein
MVCPPVSELKLKVLPTGVSEYVPTPFVNTPETPMVSAATVVLPDVLLTVKLL